ncbi:PTS sugar transporter subunit IIB [Lactobacillus sp. DCY120]|uniref:PTS sugar transporter subunit IIB n=1 Tax=Bombilactobacillus apium TaxID=2675299 RepID=A0A850R776_9LACO|nr:PTS sugar transporter subunit IIB [Bombilactobacillus apium]NVY96385.1 PTS sugar transporter subunit IIB [Bombilactobacillus apium]
MIQLVRIDDRLLHGQVAYSWKGYLDYEAIVIASEVAVKDSLRQAAMKMAKPDGVRLAIRDIPEAIKLLQNPRIAHLKTFVVTDTVAGAVELLRQLPAGIALNIGGVQKQEFKEKVTPFTYLTTAEKIQLQQLEAAGTAIDFRLVPTDTPQKLGNLIN